MTPVYLTTDVESLIKCLQRLSKAYGPGLVAAGYYDGSITIIQLSPLDRGLVTRNSKEIAVIETQGDHEQLPIEV